MKKVRMEIPVEVFVPREYQIELKLNGNDSLLVIREFHDMAVPPEAVDSTIALMTASRRENLEVQKISDRSIMVKAWGTEEVVVSCLLAEMELLNRAYAPPPPVPYLPKAFQKGDV